MNSEHSDLLLKELPKYLNNPTTSDVIFIVGEEKQQLYANSLILGIYSKKLASMIQSVKEIHFEHIDPDTFYDVLQFMYTGDIRLTVPSAEEYLSLSEELAIEPLTVKCRQFLEKNIHESNNTQGSDDRDTVAGTLAYYKAILQQRTYYHFGYPYNLDHDKDNAELFGFMAYTINNLGDPFVNSNYAIDSRQFEKEVLAFFADLYNISEEEYWGYVTSCGTEGNLHGILLGRETYPDGILYASADSHYSVFKAAHYFKVAARRIPSLDNGEINYDLLEAELLKNKEYPAILNVNIGTTVKGATDNLDRIVDILRRNNIENFYIHCDGALSGMILPFLSGDDVLSVNFDKPIGSVSISGHKFIGCPFPSGIILTRKKHMEKVVQDIEYIASKDATIMGSRNGQACLFLWNKIKRKGVDGFRIDVEHCITYANYLLTRLKEAGIKCMLNPQSVTVVFEKPKSLEFIKKWQLAVQGDIAHAIVMPNHSKEKIDLFLNELLETNRTLTEI